MKKFYFLAAALFYNTIFAQTTISFEASEGYQLGNINNQNSWEITGDGQGNFVSNQLVTNEKFTTGVYSFKNGYDAEYDPQSYPIIGGQKAFDQAVDFTNATISFDVLVTEAGASNFELATYGISASEEYLPVFDLIFDWEGTLMVINSVDYDIEDTGFEWQPNQWYAAKIEVTETEIKYYINGNLIHTTPNFTQINLQGINFLHDNYGGDAYIDNIKINDADMAVSSVNKGRVAVYPNPVKDQLTVNLPNGEKASQIHIYNMVGQNILTKNLSSSSLNLQELKAGTYTITVTTTKGTSYSSKFIKE